MPTIMFLNTWGGCLWSELAAYIRSQAHVVDVFCFQEVHQCNALTIDPHVYAVVPGHRTLPIVISQFNLLEKTLCTTHGGYFAAQMDRALHDLEPRTELDVAYGNAMFVRSTIVDARAADGFAYGVHNQLYTKDTFAARTIQSVSFKYAESAYVVAHFHGIWTGNGKGDCQERLKQSLRVINFLRHEIADATTRYGVRPKVILGGDFNLTSETRALQMLIEAPIFRDGSAVNLNAEYCVADTRTSWYPADKETREADFVLTSRDVTVQTFEAPVAPEVSDHRPLILTCT